MRFLADENVYGLAIKRLRADGHDVMSIRETFAGVADTEVLKQAAEADLILITEDQDFGELVIRRRLPVSGVVLFEMDTL